MKTAYLDFLDERYEIALKVSAYMHGDNLYIGMQCKDDGNWESFGDLTVNLPQYRVDPDEAFISGDSSREKLEFIEENNLGEILPGEAKSGFGRYKCVAFDLRKLAEFDPEGVANYCALHGISLEKDGGLNE